MKPYVLLPRDPPHDAFMASWADNPLDQTVLWPWSDRCEELGLGEEAEFLRFLAKAWWSDDESSAIPADWPEAIGRLPPEWCSVFAIGCAWRCIQWIPEEYKKEQLEDMAELVRDLGVVPFSKEARSRAEAASSRLCAASSRADATWSRLCAASSRLYAAGSRWYAANSRSYAASSLAEADEEKWQARWLEKLCQFVGV